MVQHVWRNLDDVKSPLRRKYSNRTQVKYTCLCVCRRNHDLTPYRLLVLLPPKAAALGEPGSAPCGGHGHHHKHRLGVTEHSVVHEVAVGCGGSGPIFSACASSFPQQGEERVEHIFSKKHLSSSLVEVNQAILAWWFFMNQ